MVRLGLLTLCLYMWFLCSESVQMSQVYNNLGRFSQPVDIQEQNDKIYVVQRAGSIIAFDRVNPTSSAIFLDIESDVDSSSSEEGLLGLAFHPNFSNNRRFYVYYTPRSRVATVVSAFLAPSDTQASPSSEQEIIRIEKPFPNHNGGQIQFGPDGFLYIAVGDGGSGNDPLNSGQDTDTLLGSILRIDVDQTDAPNLYAIPPSNPFAAGGGAPEIYVYGLRNPWRFSFDSQTGLMWVADVGQGSFEEIDIVSSPGQNLGWKVMEGCACSCDQSPYLLPIHSYPRSVGASVTGGYVYHGTEIPELRGHYIFGDFVSRRVFAINTNQVTPNCGTTAQELSSISITVSTFGLAGGELLAADYDFGFLYKLSPDPSISSTPTTQPRSNSPSLSAPTQLSASPVASRSSTPTPSPSISNSPPPIPPPPTTYDYERSDVDDGRTFTVEWSTDGSFIHFHISGIASGWIAIGFSTDGTMSSSGTGSDIIMGYVDSTQAAQVHDYWSLSRSQPELDEQQNIAFTDAYYIGSELHVLFSRALDTGDSFEDRALQIQNSVFLIWAISDTPPITIDFFDRHLARGSITVNLDPGNMVSFSSTPSAASTPSKSTTSSSGPSESTMTSSSPSSSSAIIPSNAPSVSRSATNSPNEGSVGSESGDSSSTFTSSTYSSLFSSAFTLSNGSPSDTSSEATRHFFMPALSLLLLALDIII